MTALVFDFGLARIGVAVAERQPPLARAIATAAAKHGEPRWPEIDKLIDVWRPQALVVGLPINMDGSASAMSHRAERFGTALAARYAMPVAYADERLSSFEARQRGASPAACDAAAAQVIAETWLQTAASDRPASVLSGR